MVRVFPLNAKWSDKDNVEGSFFLYSQPLQSTGIVLAPAQKQRTFWALSWWCEACFVRSMTLESFLLRNLYLPYSPNFIQFVLYILQPTKFLSMIWFRLTDNCQCLFSWKQGIVKKKKRSVIVYLPYISFNAKQLDKFQGDN